MKLLMIGATGYIGSVVVSTLREAGHDVVPLLRPDEANAGDVSDVSEAVRGDLAETASWQAAVTPDYDAIVHAAAPLGDWDRDAEVVRTLMAALRPGGRFVYLSGTWVLGPSTTAVPMTEGTAPRPIAIVDGREKVETSVLDSDRHGVVVRAGIVHGHAGGIPGLMVDWARDHGVGRYVAGEGEPSWPVVHVEDLADLINLALSDAPAGALLHAVSEPSVPVASIAAAADVAAGGAGRAQSWSVADATTHLGDVFAEALSTTQIVTARTSVRLGWAPRHRSIVEELQAGSYRRSSDR